MGIKNITISFDKPNLNGEVYSKGVMEKAIREYNQRYLKKQRKEKLEKIYGKNNKQLYQLFWGKIEN